MGNLFASLVLYTFPVTVAALFASMRIDRAIILSIIVGYLLLPEQIGFNAPMLPPLDKMSIPVFSALALCLVFQGMRRNAAMRLTGSGWLPTSPVARLLLAVHLVVPIATVLTNMDPVVLPARTLPGQTYYDIGNVSYFQIITVLPFLLARRYLAHPDSQAMLLRAMMAAALVYSLPILFEIRFSPQLHRWIYGFAPFPFGQQRRGDSFRPVVFLNHGLWTALFMAMATVAAATVWRTARGTLRSQAALATVWLYGVLALSSSLGALVLTTVLAPLSRFAGRSVLIAAFLFVAVTVIGYPLLRGNGLVPVGQIVAVTEVLAPARLESLQFRFDNEDLLLARANERPLFGWGGWGRNFLYNEVTGRSITVTDGGWIIIFGRTGWFGYIAQFGLLTLPLFLYARHRRLLRDDHATLGLCMVLSVNLLDILPNGTLTPVTWLVAGAVLARAERPMATMAAASLSVTRRVVPDTGRIPSSARARPVGQAVPGR